MTNIEHRHGPFGHAHPNGDLLHGHTSAYGGWEVDKHNAPRTRKAPTPWRTAPGFADNAANH